tara:strand:+ start:537 stop:869 length:333 start_codon:yes stop_codon:yes gene_type:complete
MENLFSYGTLQFKKVQQETFGRILNGKKDILRAYKLKDLIIKDKNVINSSGINTHPIIYYTGEKKDFVNGILFNVTELEIIKADSYEVSEYKRVKVKFESGNNGWVYIEK